MWKQSVSGQFVLRFLTSFTEKDVPSNFCNIFTLTHTYEVNNVILLLSLHLTVKTVNDNLINPTFVHRKTSIFD